MFYSLPNLRAFTVTEIPEPWNAWKDFAIPPEVADKDEYSKWGVRATTKHAFISGFGGVDPRSRVSKDDSNKGEANPPKWLHAVIADYDARATDADIQNIVDNPPCDYVPNYVCETFQPGRRRLIWVLDRPLLLANYASTVALSKMLARELNLRRWIPGFDEDAMHPKHYFAIGRNWRELSVQRLPGVIVGNWAAASGASVTFSDNPLAPPPIEKISELVMERFPGRWTGGFDVGSRGLRFWDPQADNPTGAVVYPEGMRCYTGGQGFMSWESIFGRKAVDELRGEVYGALREKIVWDDQRYWVLNEADGSWIPQRKEDMKDFLIDAMRLSTRKPKGGGLDPVSSFMNQVRLRGRVQEALPFIYRPTGVIEFNGDRYLNVSTVTPLPPGPPLDKPNADFAEAGAANFPWLSAYLTQLFEPPRAPARYVPASVPQYQIPLTHFLAWLHRFYVNAVKQRPLSGQALIIAGPVGAGKTFLTHGFLGYLMGGAADAGEYLAEDQQWTSEILRKPIMAIDDESSANDVRSHRRYTTKLKKLVANTQMNYNKKFGTNGRVTWTGRVIITCNLDADSLRILPDMNQSNADKIMLFQTTDATRLPDRNQLDDIVRREAPFFARWLMEWKYPEWVVTPGDNRYHIRPYHHTAMLETAMAQGSVVNLLEMLREVYDILRETQTTDVVGLQPLGPPKDFRWEFVGPVRSLYRVLRTLEVAHVDRLNMHQIGTMLGILGGRGFAIERKEDKYGNWRIVFDEQILGNVTEVGRE